jgi:hypothetical protein
METSLKTAVKNWLREQLIQLVSVQRCTLASPAAVADPVRTPDITVQTWAGIVTHIHLVDEPLKPARLRRIVEQTNGAGISLMFLVDLRLLPPPGERVPPDRWYLAVRALHKEHLYVYALQDNQPALHAVDFQPVNRLEVETRYGPELPVNHLRTFRQTIKSHHALKGYWLLADFEPERSASASAGYRPPAATNGQHAPPQAEAQESPPLENPAPPGELTVAYALLGLPSEASREDVKAAFRKLAFEVHPDVSHLPKEEAEAHFKRLSAAYETIKMRKDWA